MLSKTLSELFHYHLFLLLLLIALLNIVITLLLQIILNNVTLKRTLLDCCVQFFFIWLLPLFFDGTFICLNHFLQKHFPISILKLKIHILFTTAWESIWVSCLKLFLLTTPILERNKQNTEKVSADPNLMMLNNLFCRDYELYS